jgi:hypothetical protein
MASIRASHILKTPHYLNKNSSDQGSGEPESDCLTNPGLQPVLARVFSAAVLLAGKSN